MLERLYQPDFSSIFGKAYANAFLYDQVDSLVWPIFIDVEMSDLLKKLLSLKNQENREYFYRRKVSIEDEKVELYCSNIQLALIQAMDLGREYGISNSDVVGVSNKDPKLFKGVLSFNPVKEKDIISKIKSFENQIEIAGIVLYPSYIKLDLINENKTLKELLDYCKSKNYFVKIDIGNLFLPNNNPEYSSPEKIKAILSRNSENVIILSGLDVSGDFCFYYPLLKYFNNLWVEIDPRTFGGMTPTDCFKQLFNLKGFVQNCWHRMLIGSATPMLEMPQMVRGFIEATEDLPFSQKCLLRTWAFRNINRLNPSVFVPIYTEKIDMFNTVLKVDQNKIVENDNEINIIYKVELRSYSVTQLIFITQLIKDIFSDALKKYPSLQNGELFIRSYHTTTSLIINEHEYGNYFDMHYKFSDISRKDSSQFLHTAKALENRADFNHFDHELAYTYGSKQLILPIVNGALEIGGRENFYILVTFGPRTLQVFVKIRLIKEKEQH